MNAPELPIGHPQYGAMDVEDGRIIERTDCPVCSGELVTSWTPEQARQAAAVLIALAVLADGEVPGDLMRPAEVARAFGVDRRTVNRWAAAGKLTVIRTPGGVRRFDRDQVEALLAAGEHDG